MNKLILILSSLFLFQTAYSQQLPLFTQYRDNIGVINPAAFSHDFLMYEHTAYVGASYRRQWLGIDSAPETQTLRGEYIYEGGSVALVMGGYLINDQTGPTGFTGAYGRAAVVITDDPYYGGISVGLTAGAVQYRVNASEIRLRESGDVLGSMNIAQIFPDVGVGVYAYKYVDGGFLDDSHIYAGISIPQVTGLNLEFSSEDGRFETKRLQHYYALAGLYKYLNDGAFIQPSVWVKYVPNAPVNADFNLRFQTAANFWLGAGASTAGLAHLEVGFIGGENSGGDNHFKLGYGFDYSFNSYGPDAGTSHEINLAFTFGN